MVISKYRKPILILILTLSIAAVVFAPLIGTHKTSLINLINDQQTQDIILNIRAPRVIFAFLVGFSLALVGTVFQALLRNDLATPYTLGVSSGGAFGTVLAIKLGMDITLFGFSTSILFSVLSSVSTIIIIYIISRGKSGISATTLILAGVTISLFFSSLILFIHYLADFTETYRMIRWLMGGLQITDWNYCIILGIFAILTFAYIVTQSSALNIIVAGKEVALSKGVDVKRLQKWSFLIGSVLTGIVVAFAGPIGFIGLIIPHLMRLITGTDHRILVISASLVGGTFLVCCDTLARTIISPAELPVGVITSLIGGPFFIWLLIRRKTTASQN